MKHKIQILFFSTIIILLAACTRQTIIDDDDVESTWNIHFILTDSADRPLLPIPLPHNPPFNPNEFRAYNDKNENIGKWFEGKLSDSDSTQIMFYLSETFESIEKNPVYIKDSLFKWYVCFGNQCDTVIIYPKPFLYGIGHNPNSDAKMLIWGKDTIHDYNGQLLRISK